MRQQYTNFTCIRSHWDHRKESSIGNVPYLNCTMLINGAYPYVERMPFGAGTMEFAWDHDHTKYATYIEAPCEVRDVYYI